LRLDEAGSTIAEALDHAPVSARALLGLGNCALRRESLPPHIAVSRTP